jgi:hypothetical protein
MTATGIATFTSHFKNVFWLIDEAIIVLSISPSSSALNLFQTLSGCEKRESSDVCTLLLGGLPFESSLALNQCRKSDIIIHRNCLSSHYSLYSCGKDTPTSLLSMRRSVAIRGDLSWQEAMSTTQIVLSSGCSCEKAGPLTCELGLSRTGSNWYFLWSSASKDGFFFVFEESDARGVHSKQNISKLLDRMKNLQEVSTNSLLMSQSKLMGAARQVQIRSPTILSSSSRPSYCRPLRFLADCRQVEEYE